MIQSASNLFLGWTAGDALNRADVENALAGCDAVHISIDHAQEDACVTRVVEAAQSQGLKRITYVSGTTVCEENRWFRLVDRKLKSEQAIRESGIDDFLSRLVYGDADERLRAGSHLRAMVYAQIPRNF